MMFQPLILHILSSMKEWRFGMCKRDLTSMRYENRSVKYCLAALFAGLIASVASPSARAHTGRSIDIAMASPVDFNSPHRANDAASGKPDLARITYTPTRSSRGSAISPALLNNEKYNGDRRARLRGDRFEWQRHGNPE